MKSEGAKNVLAVLSLANATVKSKKDTIDLSKTYTTEFADTAK
jgi:NitT/TauT family transport system substrate-binding protein